MSMKRTWPISSPISFLTSVDTVGDSNRSRANPLHHSFGAADSQSFSKRGSFRSGSNIGSSRSSAGVSGGICPKSFRSIVSTLAQGDDRAHPGRAPRRYVACQKYNHHEDQWHSDKHFRINRPNSVQQTGNQRGHDPRQDQADHHSNASQARAPAYNHFPNGRGRGSQSHAHSDLVRPLTHHIGQQTVNSYRRQQKRHHGKYSHQLRGEAARSQRTVNDLIHRTDVENRQVRIDCLNLTTYLRL